MKGVKKLFLKVGQGKLEWVNDGLCDDMNNNDACNYDGGDCCGSCVITEFCSECACLGNITGMELSNPLIGNGYCNDVTNNFQCDFDGLDCCGPPVNTDFCSECSCHGEHFSLSNKGAACSY